MAEVNQQQVIEYIKGISVLELSQLVKTLEELQALARERGVKVKFGQADVHAWPYPDGAFDVVRGMLRSGDIVLIKSSKSANLRHLGDQLAEAKA